jgi:hypothetical protein
MSIRKFPPDLVFRGPLAENANPPILSPSHYMDHPTVSSIADAGKALKKSTRGGCEPEKEEDQAENRYTKASVTINQSMLRVKYFLPSHPMNPKGIHPEQAQGTLKLSS